MKLKNDWSSQPNSDDFRPGWWSELRFALGLYRKGLAGDVRKSLGKADAAAAAVIRTWQAIKSTLTPRNVIPWLILAGSAIPMLGLLVYGLIAVLSFANDLFSRPVVISIFGIGLWAFAWLPAFYVLDLGARATATYEGTTRRDDPNPDDGKGAPPEDASGDVPGRSRGDDDGTTA